MTSPHHDWEECDWEELTDKDEIAELIKVINKQPLEFASEEEIQTHSETAERFIELVLGCEWAFISDESSLYDFESIDEVTNLEEKIKEVFGVDVSDIEDKNLFRIFERIDGSV